MNKRIQVSLFSALLALVLAACGNAAGTTTSGSADVPTNSSSTKTQTTASSTVPLTVMSVDIALDHPTIRNIACGANMTETYTATFHFPANNAGGQVNFTYTTNNGRGSQPASLSVHRGQTSATYTFSWSGQLDASNTLPGRGGVMVTSPNAYTSDLVAPLGPCNPGPPPAAAPFSVTSIDLVAGPEVTGHRCGSSFTENYTATFHIAVGGPGGSIVFQYTTNNGRSSSSNVSLPVAAGQTTATYTFYWSGQLPQSHTAPGIGIVMMSAPNQIISPAATPPGGCNNM
ncbi:hypothetical protein [Dictyobacter arantiisoli]|uniref:Uncharacterized protein n=1 Tax=Dictyobacter arantiisoli TaxID=2014874 RepID=A0A5A5TGA7_9CHLR|nr:hypothetical protein [Dictyobacter arantiisoli]GCF10611.1 hypothetical protein KDI_41750 [Dictyobacter arantiisoli]